MHYDYKPYMHARIHEQWNWVFGERDYGMHPKRKKDTCLQKPLLLLCHFAVTNEAPEDTNAAQKLHEQSCTVFWKLVCVLI